MKYQSFLLSVLIFCGLSVVPANAQHYQGGVTTYSNGTQYIPQGMGGNTTDSDIVQTSTTESKGSGVFETKEETIFCKRNPQACKEALEEAADTEEQLNPTSSNWTNGTGGEQTHREWLEQREIWGNYPPIFFPGGGPGKPIARSRIRSWTNEIIRGIR